MKSSLGNRAGVLVLLGLAEAAGFANGIDRDGAGARAMSLGGAVVADPSDALATMGANPAGLALLDRSQAQLGAVGGSASGRYEKAGVGGGRLDRDWLALPEGALAWQSESCPVAVGLSFIPESALHADWTYPDAPGGLGGAVSYGLRRHRSEILLLRSALGAAIEIHPKLAFGVSLGLLYNENRLTAPYIFQNLEPAGSAGVNGAKTLLDLETSGFGFNAQAGLIYSPVTNVHLGLSYKTASEISSNGRAAGDPYAQFGVAPGPLAFNYDATVRTSFPHELAAGISWAFLPRWQVSFQADWIDWSGSFDELPVRLRNGDNAAVNGAVGAAFQDNIPLNWRDRFVYRTGLEYALLDHLFLRAGYAYGASPVPPETLTPLTGAIMEHLVSAGAGLELGAWAFDAAWQYFPQSAESIATSSLRSGEYSNSRVEVSMHRVALTASYRF